MNPTETQSLSRQRGVYDLNTMDEVLLVKKGNFTPVTTLEDAKARVGGDTTKFLAIINDGLKAEAGRSMLADPSIPWLVEAEDGTTTPFDGKIGDIKIVNGLILNLAKSIFGYAKELPKDQKKAAKESAIDLIKSNEVMKAGLIKNAAAASDESEVAEETK